MNHEFITLDSKLTIKKGVINQKQVKVNTDEGFTRFIAFIALLVFLGLCIYKIIEDRDYIAIVQIILILVWLEPHIKRIYKSLFIKTWKSTIKLSEIKKITSLPLENGIETSVILHLSNGRKKFYTFRNLENQAENFIQSVSINENSVLKFS